jgi:hypothetical protein
MSPPPGLIDLIHRLEDCFDQLRLKRSYGGAIAYNFHGPPRFTQDIDILVVAEATKTPAFVEGLSSIGYRQKLEESTGEIDLNQFLREIRSKPYFTVLYCGNIRTELLTPWHPFHYRVLERSPERTGGAHDPDPFG